MRRTNSRACTAKRLIKSSVIKRRSIDITQSMMKYWFDVLNRAAFRSELTTPDFLILNMRLAYGEAHSNGKRSYIKLNKSRIHDFQLFIGTLAHEMVHLYQHMEESFMHHGRSFLQWKRYFKHQMNISI